MNPSQQTIRERLQAYAAQQDGRDQLVRDAFEAGETKTYIHRITGIARTTIDRIVGTIPQTSSPGAGTPPSPGTGPTTNRPER